MAFDAPFLIALVLLIVGCGVPQGKTSPRRLAGFMLRPIRAARMRLPSSTSASRLADCLARWCADLLVKDGAGMTALPLPVR